MRSRRLGFVFIALYFVFIGGSAYYNLIFPVRVFHHGLVTIALGLWYWRKFRGEGLPHTPLNRPLYVLVLVWFISSALSIDPRMSFENTWFMLLHVSMYFVLVDMLQYGRQRLIFETQFILAALVVMITGMELASWYFGLGITPGTAIGWIDVIGPGAWLPLEAPRVALAMNISTLLAGYVAPLVTITVAWAMTARQADFRFALWWLAGALFVVLILTFSRGGLLSVLASLGVFTMLRLGQHQRIKRLISPSVVVAVALIGVAFVMGVFVTSQTRAGGDIIRLDLYRSAVEITEDRPVTGVGVGIFGRAYRDYRVVSILTRDKLISAHNLALNVMAETGVVGLLVHGWLGATFLLAWWKVRNQLQTEPRRIRHEAVLAALIGVGMHSLVDVFSTTPVMTVIVLLAAYGVTGHRTVLDERPVGTRWVAGVALVIVLGYGVFFVLVDRAQATYRSSFVGGDDGIEAARQAAELDPGLNLYTLQVAYLIGERAYAVPTKSNLDEAVAAYERALELEPTWDVGWLNLAALEDLRGNVETTIEYLETAIQISTRQPGNMHLGRLREQSEVKQTPQNIVADYRLGLFFNLDINDRLPLSEFWTQSSLREKTVYRYVYLDPISEVALTQARQYRILSEFSPEAAVDVVPDEPQTADEFWIAGQHALVVLNDPETAAELFSEAINHNRDKGDYYVSRARATLETDPEAAQRDLDLATLLDAEDEYPNAVRAQMTTDIVERDQLLAQAIPAGGTPQEFAAVLYGGRAAIFDVLPNMRPVGPGTSVMQPWYDLAEGYLNDGFDENAMQVYEAIVDYAPDETLARELLGE